MVLLFLSFLLCSIRAGTSIPFLKTQVCSYSHFIPVLDSRNYSLLCLFLIVTQTGPLFLTTLYFYFIALIAIDSDCE